MTKIIALLLTLGQFDVAVETAKGYFVGTYPDTEAGVTQFVDAIKPALGTTSGRFYSCLAYDGPERDVMQSPLAVRIKVAEALRIRRAEPGVADAPWIIRTDPLKAYLVKHPAEKLDARLVEKICVSLLPNNYMTLYPAKAGVVEFYR